MEYFVAGLVKSLAEKLEYIRPLDSHEHHFYLPAETHVVEGFWTLLFSCIFIYASQFGGMKHTKWPAGRSPPTRLEKVIRTILTINLAAQVMYKTYRGWKVLTYMLQPCHAESALLLYVMYTSNHKMATRVFQISLHYMFFTTLAIAVPDLASLQLPFEQVNFWVQHYILVVVPIYLIAVRRFELSPSWGLTSLAIGFGMFFHFYVQAPAALLSGVNVNYMLWPPPGVPPIIANAHYRIILTFTFMLLATLTGYYLPKLVIRLQKEEMIHAQKHAQKVVRERKDKKK